jgi:hypothetical protein
MNSETRQVLTELREMAIAMMPATSPTPPVVFDARAEVDTLASLYRGFWPNADIDPASFYLPLHRAIANVLVSARAVTAKPTIELVLRGLEHLDVRGAHLERAVRRILETEETFIRPNAAWKRISQLAWRRRFVGKLDRLRALLVDSSVSDDTLGVAWAAIVADVGARGQGLERAA